MPLSVFVAAGFKKLRTAQAEALLAAGALWHNPHDLVITALGTPLEARNDARDFYKIREAAGLP